MEVTLWFHRYNVFAVLVRFKVIGDPPQLSGDDAHCMAIKS